MSVACQRRSFLAQCTPTKGDECWPAALRVATIASPAAITSAAVPPITRIGSEEWDRLERVSRGPRRWVRSCIGTGAPCICRAASSTARAAVASVERFFQELRKKTQRGLHLPSV